VFFRFANLKGKKVKPFTFLRGNNEKDIFNGRGGGNSFLPANDRTGESELSWAATSAWTPCGTRNKALTTLIKFFRPGITSLNATTAVS